MEKANNKREAALKSAERAEKKTRKKAKTVEITRRCNQENQGTVSFAQFDLYNHLTTPYRAFDRDDTCRPSPGHACPSPVHLFSQC